MKISRINSHDCLGTDVGSSHIAHGAGSFLLVKEGRSRRSSVYGLKSLCPKGPPGGLIGHCGRTHFGVVRRLDACVGRVSD